MNSSADYDQTVRVIVGLGNPGEEYENTRHNVGFLVVDLLAKALNISFKGDRKCKALVGYSVVNKIKIVLVKPKTYMNLSGVCVKELVNFYKLDLKNLFVVSDDAEMDIGRLKLKKRGGTGGHNGLKSITDELSSSEYTRLRMGISKNKEIPLKDYVLGQFSKAELVELEGILETAKQVALEWAFYGFGSAEMLLSRQLQKGKSEESIRDNNMEKRNG